MESSAPRSSGGRTRTNLSAGASTQELSVADGTHSETRTAGRIFWDALWADDDEDQAEVSSHFFCNFNDYFGCKNLL